MPPMKNLLYKHTAKKKRAAFISYMSLTVSVGPFQVVIESRFLLSSYITPQSSV